ncbi:MAG TPA: hypothetical protein VK335_15605 [Bryobacteraceae bacterium]|nr:hypothetical protein [Bryobacteraceae bacterium]
MAKSIPPHVLAYLRQMGKTYGGQGGKKAAKNMTAQERSARARKAAKVAVRKRTAKRLARKNQGKPAKKKAANVKVSRTYSRTIKDVMLR